MKYSWWSFSKYFVFLLSILSLIAVTVFTLQNLSQNQKLTEVFREDYPLLYDSNEQVFPVSYSNPYTCNCKFSSTCYSWWLFRDRTTSWSQLSYMIQEATFRILWTQIMFSWNGYRLVHDILDIDTGINTIRIRIRDRIT